MELKPEDIEKLKGLFQNNLKETEISSTDSVREGVKKNTKIKEIHPRNPLLDVLYSYTHRLSKLENFISNTTRLKQKDYSVVGKLFKQYEVFLQETLNAYDQLYLLQPDYKFKDARELRIKRIEGKFMKWHDSNKPKDYTEIENLKVETDYTKHGTTNHYEELKWVLRRKLSKLNQYILDHSVNSLIMSEFDTLFNDVICHFEKVKVNAFFQEVGIEEEIKKLNILKKTYYDIKEDPSLISKFSTVNTLKDNTTDIHKIINSAVFFTSSKYFIKFHVNGNIHCVGKKIHRFPFIRRQWKKTEGDIVKYILCRCNVTEIEKCKESEFLSAEKMLRESQTQSTALLPDKRNSVSKEQIKSKNVTPQERKTKMITLHWVAVFFGQKYIRVFYKDVWHRFEYEQSRPIFESYKPLLRLGQLGFLSLEVDLLDQKPIKVHNLSLLDILFDRLEIERLLTNTELGRIQYLVQLNGESWTNERVQKAYKLRDRTPYLTHLCQIFDLSLKIIPVREVCSHDSTDSILEEDAFLFPVRKNNRVYIFWESVELENRATHIFWCSTVEYQGGLQQVFDYIANPGITNKRQKLRTTRMDYFQQGAASYAGSVNHIAFDDWKQRVQQLCS